MPNTILGTWNTCVNDNNNDNKKQKQKQNRTRICSLSELALQWKKNDNKE